MNLVIQQCLENRKRGVWVSGIFWKFFKDFLIMRWLKVSGDLKWPPEVSKQTGRPRTPSAWSKPPSTTPHSLVPQKGLPALGRERLNVKRAERTLGKHGEVVRLHLLWLAPGLHLLNFVLVPHTHALADIPISKRKQWPRSRRLLISVSFHYLFLFPASTLLWLTLAAAGVMGVTGVLCGDHYLLSCVYIVPA